jgi:hypothetical protein
MEPAYIQTRAVLLLLLAPVWATAVRPGIRRLGDTVIVVQDTAQPVVLQAMMNATVSDLEFQASWPQEQHQLRRVLGSTPAQEPISTSSGMPSDFNAMRVKTELATVRHV